MSLKWWQEAVFYQIYPRSFADGNGDGIGDFIGMTSKLDYLQDLGIDAIWLSPHFPSSNWDIGYDIKDYCGVGAEYGTVDDFKNFLTEAHNRGIRVILDLVANHTSDEHAWFLQSKSSRTNPKADWYVWQDTPPNNWQSCFDGDAWTYSPERGQYYYHYFMKQQPDLNWHNPAVVEAMWDAVRFWLDLGVDGYRLDAIGTIYEDPDLTPHNVPHTLSSLRIYEGEAKTPEEKEKVRKFWTEMFKYQHGQDGVHQRMKELRSVLDEYEGDRMLVGEDDNPAYLGNGEDELHLVFNFPLMQSDGGLTPEHIIKNQQTRLAALANISPEAWPCNTLGNHDCARVYNQFGDGIHDAEKARLSIALMMTLRGTPFLYNGEEIGMSDYIITDPTLLTDTMATWYYSQLVNTQGVSKEEAAKRAGIRSRDKNRTPMQWTSEPNAGFSPPGIKTWLPINPNYKDGINVNDQSDDPNSLLSFYKKMIRFRRNHRALVDGDFQVIELANKDVLCFSRTSFAQSLIIVMNYSPIQHHLSFPPLGAKQPKLLFSSAGRNNKEFTLEGLKLGSFEILISEIAY